MKKFKLSFCFLAILFLIFSCTDEDNSKKDSAHAYVVGTFNNGSTWTPAYWKDGVVTELSQEDGYLLSVATDGSDIYALGYLSANRNQIIIWKNGEPNLITDGTTFARANDIAISSDHDVYIVGLVRDNNNNNNAVYWKNGEINILSNTVSSASFIELSGGDVYIGGYSTDANNNSIGTYWKNKIATMITGSTRLNEIEVEGSVVHVVGVGTGSVAKYWMNGEEINSIFQNNNGSSFGVYDIKIENSNVFIAGTIDDSGALWKNGVSMTLPASQAGGFTIAYSVIPIGKNTYVSGYQAKTVNGVTTYYEYVWKNGELIAPFDGTLNNFSVHRICVGL